jgi:MoaA/NifB/PqqE/SkfB family radical SAM enzyme
VRNAHLKLKEIVWEITGRCENGCDYCGSKDGWNEKLDEQRAIKIAKAIAEYPPEAIDISGGDPLLVSLKTHQRIVEVLADMDVMCKILVNPRSLDRDEAVSILAKYDWIGLSVNAVDELAIAKTHRSVLEGSCGVTVVTNFNTNNVFDFDVIHGLVQDWSVPWQVQYTMYNDDNDTRAIYRNNSAMAYLADRLAAASGKSRLVLADNLNAGECGAGLCSLGVLSNGDVVPCLSMRSWCDTPPVQGNLLETGLDELWQTRFQNQRFGCFKCCKDHCGQDILNLLAASTQPDLKRLEEATRLPLAPQPSEPPKDVRPVAPGSEPIIMYGVGMPSTPRPISPVGPVLYGVVPDDTTYVYGIGGHDVKPKGWTLHPQPEDAEDNEETT